MAIDPKVIDKLLADYEKPEDIIGENGLLKQLKGDFGTLEIAVPRDPEASFEPKLVPKGTTRFAGFDDKLLSLYARHDDARDSRAPGRDIPGERCRPP
jgi:putative transposase